MHTYSKTVSRKWADSRQIACNQQADRFWVAVEQIEPNAMQVGKCTQVGVQCSALERIAR